MSASVISLGKSLLMYRGKRLIIPSALHLSPVAVFILTKPPSAQSFSATLLSCFSVLSAQAEASSLFSRTVARTARLRRP